MKRQSKGYFVGKTSAEYHQDYRKRNPEQCLLAAARNRARKKDIPFDITVEDIIIPENCPILGIPLTRNLGQHGGTYSSASIDKIIPDLGYIKGNIQVISLLANNMKSNATKEQLLLFSNWIQKEYG